VRLPATQALGRLRRMGKVVLTTSDAALHLGLSPSAATRMLGRLASAGLALRLRHGLWSLDPAIDPLLVVEHLTAPFPAYVSLLSALSQHGMISQIPHVIYVASLAPTKRITTEVAHYSIHRLAPTFFGGFVTTPGGVRLATPEKALLDVLYLGPARSRLFAALPEVELPAGFSVAEAERWLNKVPEGPRRTMMDRRLHALLAGASRARPRRRRGAATGRSRSRRG
jgi:Transcriptional regulator, AbiEi antitoxin